MPNIQDPILQASGPISLGDIANEFAISPMTNIKLSQYQRGGAVVKNIYTNRNISGVAGVPAPSFPSISIGQFYKASHFLLSVKFEINHEQYHKYGWFNDGWIKVHLTGVSGSGVGNEYAVTIRNPKGGIDSVWQVVGATTQKTTFLSDEGMVQFSGLNYGAYTIEISDVQHHNMSGTNPPVSTSTAGYKQPWKFDVVVNYNNPSVGGSVTGFTLNTVHVLEAAGVPGGSVPLPPVTPPPFVPGTGITTLDAVPNDIVFFDGDFLIPF